MAKKKAIVSFKKLPTSVQDKVLEVYGGDLTKYARKIPKGNNDFFYAIDFDTEDTEYLIKVDVTFDKTLDESRIERMLQQEEGHLESQKMFYRSGFSRKS